MSTRAPIEDQANATGLERLVSDRLRLLDQVPFLRGVEVMVGAQSAGLFNVIHRLAMVPRGFIILDVRTAAGETKHLSIYRRQGDNRSATILQLYTTLAFDLCKLWVF